MVKAYVCKAAEWVTREAMQIHGGFGFAEEYTVSRLLRRRPGAVHLRGRRRDAVPEGDRPPPARRQLRLTADRRIGRPPDAHLGRSRSADRSAQRRADGEHHWHRRTGAAPLEAFRGIGIRDLRRPAGRTAPAPAGVARAVQARPASATGGSQEWLRRADLLRVPGVIGPLQRTCSRPAGVDDGAPAATLPPGAAARHGGRRQRGPTTSCTGSRRLEEVEGWVRRSPRRPGRREVAGPAPTAAIATWCGPARPARPAS